MIILRSQQDIVQIAQMKNLGHAYLFQYDAGAKIATETARSMLCAQLGEVGCRCVSCVAYSHGVHLEYFVVSGNDGIDAVRDVLARGRVSIRSHCRVTCITDAHLLSTEAATTLLKYLEEPISNHIFILSSPRGIALKTLHSRCVVVACALPVDNQDVWQRVRTQYAVTRQHYIFLKQFASLQKSDNIKLSSTTKNNLLAIGL